jgi:hypothetical protein
VIRQKRREFLAPLEPKFCLTIMDFEAVGNG